MEKELIGQIISIIATVLTFISYQTNTDKRIISLQTGATSLHCVAYLLLGASSGFALNIVCIVRNLCYFFFNNKPKLKFMLSVIFAAVLVIVGIFSWQGPLSLFMIFALPINTIILSLGKPQLLRKSILLTSSSILVYNSIVFTIGGIINEMIAIISSVIGIIRFRNIKGDKEANSIV